jgi:hypothetical protein
MFITLLPHMFLAAGHVYRKWPSCCTCSWLYCRTCFCCCTCILHMFFAAAHVYHTCWAVLINSSSCDLTSHSFWAKLWDRSKYFLKQLNSRIYLIHAVIIFLSTAWHASSSWHFCVNRFLWAIAIQAVEHLPKFTMVKACK